MSERSGWQLASGSVAEAYERYIMSPFGNAWAQALVQVAAPTEGERVLDVACGTGAVARFTAPLVGPTGLVTGLDLNAGMLDIARTMPFRKALPSHGRKGARSLCPSRMLVMTWCAATKAYSFSQIVPPLCGRCSVS